eukprot:1931365-Pyramimonas_sp.AAC.1
MNWRTRLSARKLRRKVSGDPAKSIFANREHAGSVANDPNSGHPPRQLCSAMVSETNKSPEVLLRLSDRGKFYIAVTNH